MPLDGKRPSESTTETTPEHRAHGAPAESPQLQSGTAEPHRPPARARRFDSVAIDIPPLYLPPSETSFDTEYDLGDYLQHYYPVYRKYQLISSGARVLFGLSILLIAYSADTGVWRLIVAIAAVYAVTEILAFLLDNRSIRRKTRLVPETAPPEPAVLGPAKTLEESAHRVTESPARASETASAAKSILEKYMRRSSSQTSGESQSRPPEEDKPKTAEDPQ